MKKDVLLAHFGALGFELEEIPEFGYSFSYDELHYLLVWDEEEDESDSVRIAIPNIFEVNADNRVEVLEAANDIAGRLKYVKAVVTSDRLWLFYEHYLVTEENCEEQIEHMVRALQVALHYFYQNLEGETEELDESDE